ncbi:MAG TPA: cytochrome c oxidase subunit II [Pyrinomonadaceae bacterium]
MGRLLAVLIVLITAVSVWLFLDGRWWLPPGITEHSPAYDAQFLLTIVVVGISFVGAQVGLAVAVWRYGAKRNDRTQRAVYSHGNNRLEIIWTIITLVIFVGVGLLGQRVWANLHFYDAPPGATRIHVYAQQFQWNFHYPGADNAHGRTEPTLIRDAELNFVGLDPNDPHAKDDSVVTTLIVPVNRPVELTLRSKDVTHAIWVPETRFKQDAVPGMSIKVQYTPVQTGKFELACAELCGQLHFKMKSYMLVLPQAQYDELARMPQAQFQQRVTQLLREYRTRHESQQPAGDATTPQQPRPQ